jgi:hypothetical protein
MTKSSLGRLVACVAWAGVAISSATPADALIVSKVGGAPYANCSADWNYYYHASCGMEFHVVQRIRMVSQACNGGTCDNESGGIMVEFVYASSRKIAEQVADCGPYSYLYGLDTCSC